MDTTIPIPPTTTADPQVQGSLASDSPKATRVEEEVHNQSGDSTDSLKENQPENNRSSRSLQNDSALSKSSSSHPLEAPTDNSLTGDQRQQQHLQPHPTTQGPTCNDSAFPHSTDDEDDESFADCPSFNSPAVNKLLLLGRSSSEARQSLGLDALANNLGRFTFDSPSCANFTVDIVATGGALANDVEQVIEETAIENKQSEIAPVLKDDLLPPPPPPPELVFPHDQAEDDLNNFTCDDVEMMSVVMENLPGEEDEEEDYASVPLPDEGEEAFPDPPPPSTSDMDVEWQEGGDIQEIPESPVEAAEEQTVEDPLNVTGPIADEDVASPDSPPEQLHPEQHSITRAQSMNASQGAVDFGDFPKDFKMPTVLRRSLNQPQSFAPNPFDGATSGIADHKQEVFFSSKDFDFLQSKETANSLSTAIKDSVLLRFDPLFNQPVPVESRTAEAAVSADIPSCDVPLGHGGRQLQHPVRRHSEGILEEELQPDEDGYQEDSLLQVFGVVRSQQAAPEKSRASFSGLDSSASGGEVKRNDCPISKLVDVTMSLVDVNNDSNLSVTAISGVGVVDKECSVLNGVGGGGGVNNHSTNLSNINLEDLEFSKLRMSVDGGQQHHNQSNGETKIRHERYDDMDRKMREMEEKEEVLLKRLSEKEKQIAKMGHIVEEYERSIAGLMKERAVTKEEYERRCAELETERNANYQHLSSLETTFSDLHVKYERSKQQMEALKRSEEILLADKKQSTEQAAMQEQRYDKLKSHAMQQMEIANIRLRDESSQANQEISRLRALLKKEEITRCSLQEQLNQKTREIEELMKIWDELKSDP